MVFSTMFTALALLLVTLNSFRALAFASYSSIHSWRQKGAVMDSRPYMPSLQSSRPKQQGSPWRMIQSESARQQTPWTCTLLPLCASNSDDNENTTNGSQRYRPGSLMAATAEQGRVPYGEESRKYRRTVFTHSDWIEHRNSERVITNIKGIFFSGIIRQLRREIGLVALVATLVVLWNGVLVPYALTQGVSLSHFSLPPLPFTLSSPALGLLLVFRTNSSYSRWMDARVIWAKIIAQSRNMIRMAGCFADMSTVEGRQKLERLSNATWLLCRTIVNKFSGPEDNEPFEEEIKSVLTKTVDSSLVPRILSAPDRTSAAMCHASLALDNTPIDEKRRVEIDKSLVLIGDYICQCERIYSSPVPLVYTRHTARFLSLWMLLVPTALYDSFASFDREASTYVDSSSWLSALPHGLSLIPACSIVALFLFGIEELAFQLEEPFTILPMQKFCDEIKEQTKGMTDWFVESAEMEIKATSSTSTR